MRKKRMLDGEVAALRTDREWRMTSMIKGKFVATIEIDIAVDENTPNLLPFEKLKEAVHNEMEAAVNDMLCEEFGDIATVKVTKSFADLYRTEDKHEDD